MSDGANPDTVEVSKADLAILQKSYKLLNSLWDHPEHGMQLKRAAKAADPTLRVPELDVAEPMLKPITEKMAALEERLTAKDDEIAKIRQEREDEKALGKLSKDLGGAQKRYSLTDEGMAEVKKLMIDRGISDPFAAAALVASEIEPAKPVTGTNFGPQEANVLAIDGSATDDDTRMLHNDPMKWQDREVSRIMDEFERGEAA